MKKMTILLVEPGKKPEVAKIGKNLKDMQAVVGGLIQATYPFEEPVALVCNDEGKLMGLPWNRGLYDGDGNLYDVVAGTFFICGLGEDDFCSLSEEQVKKFSKLYEHPEYFL